MPDAHAMHDCVGWGHVDVRRAESRRLHSTDDMMSDVDGIVPGGGVSPGDAGAADPAPPRRGRAAVPRVRPRPTPDRAI